MPSIVGNTSGSVYLIDYNEGCTLESFTLVNKTAGTVTANLAIRENETDYYIIPVNTPIYGNQMYSSYLQRQMNANNKIHLVVNAEVDYQFSTGKPK